MKFTKLDITKSRILRKKSTPQEIILWSRLRNRRLRNYKFRRQFPIGRYVADFVCLENKLIIELDGWQHKEENQERYDQERSRILKSLDYKILRFWNNEINKNLDGVILEIEKNL